jgi:hypothetical protein
MFRRFVVAVPIALVAVLTVGVGAAQAATQPAANVLNPITCTNEAGNSAFHPTVKTATPLTFKESTNAALTGCSNNIGSTVVLASVTAEAAYVAPAGFGGCVALGSGLTYLHVFKATVTWTVLNNPNYNPPTVTYTSKIALAGLTAVVVGATTITITGNFAASGTDAALYGAPFTLSGTFVTPNCVAGFNNLAFTGPAGITVT